MPSPNTIINISSDWIDGTEDMGSKRKFWFLLDGERNNKWLYKKARPNTGEHWAEKVASEVAELLELPTHQVSLAEYNGQAGCAVKSFLRTNEDLIHGNELLAGCVSGYDKDKQYGQSDHHFKNIVKAVTRGFPHPKQQLLAAEQFVGYMVLDALVGNTDRHHENWGITQWIEVTDNPETKKLSITEKRKLAPTFDHGSSLGRELLDEKRQMLLDEPNGVARYIKKGKGGIFQDREQKRGMNPIELVKLIAVNYPELFKPWQRKIAALPETFISPILDNISEDHMTATSKAFCLAFTSESRKLIEEIT